ncbi:glutamate receptor-like, partial [Toxorhynchites rutilus septentrionalis]|uniref:glutamate receptor-like n=1 Tax=Toxorhynchites rutilus septentrionalis TaxID=329112 RepID=UPI00247A983D
DFKIDVPVEIRSANIHAILVMNLLRDILSTNNGTLLALLIDYLASTFLSEYYCVCVVNSEHDHIPLNVALPRIVFNGDVNFYQNFQYGVDSGCRAFIVQEPTLWPFLDGFITIHDKSDQRSDKKKLIVLSDSPVTGTLKRICDHPSIKELPETVIIGYHVAEHENESIDAYTTEIFSDGTRGSTIVDVRPIIPPNYFPKKTQMNGIPIRFRTVMYPPFGYYEETTIEKANARYDPQYGTDDTPLFIDGTEPSLLVEFCHRYNCTIEAYFDETELWGAVFDNHTGTGLLGAVATRKADFAVAAIYYWLEVYRFAAFTAPIGRSGVTVLVPRARMVAPWRTPFLTFSRSLWIAVAVAFIAGMMSVWLIERIRFREMNKTKDRDKTLSDSVLTLIGFFMEQTAYMRNDVLSCAFLYTSLLFAGFMISNLYGAGLATIMTIPQYGHGIDNTIDLAASGIPFAGSDLAWIFAIMNASQPHLRTLVKNYLVGDRNFFTQHRRTRDMGFIGERTEFGHFGPVDFVDAESSKVLRLLKDDLAWETTAALVTKTCPFRGRFDEFLMRIRQSGIQYYWELRIVNRYINVNVQQNIFKTGPINSDSEAAPLLLIHVTGAFMILGFGLTISTFVFIWEYLNSKWTGRQFARN